MSAIQLTILAAVVLAAIPAFGAEPRIEVFTLGSLLVSHVREATVHVVDAMTRLDEEVSLGLPADPQRAQALAMQRLVALGPQLAARARGALGLARAAELGVQRVPAIVFDSRWVVYGVSDVDVARRIFATRAAQTGR